MKIYDHLLGISHEAHPAHKLKLVTTNDGRPFRCDGCMEPGSGEVRRYRCDLCDFDLHTSCALAESTLKHHLFGELEFQFILHPPPAVHEKICNACGYVTSGLVYHCLEKDINLHPCCAALKMKTVLANGHILELCKEAKQNCLFCGEKGRPLSSSAPPSHMFWVRKEKLWAYRWRHGISDGYLHVACMKKIAAQAWEQTYQDSPGGGIAEASVPVMRGIHSSRNSENANKMAINGLEMGTSIAKVISATALL